METYLSVDLDFFNDRPKSELIRLCHDILNKVQSKDILLVDTHEELLPHCAAIEPDLLVNVDEHSDLTEDKTAATFPHCGNWVNFSKAKKYRWLAPNREVTSYYNVSLWGNKTTVSQGKGRCDNTEHFFTKKCASLRTIKDAAIWYGLKKIPWNTVARVGIALSVEYTSREVLKVFGKECYSDLKRAGMVTSMPTATITYLYVLSSL
jgi:hypothetical protein